MHRMSNKICSSVDICFILSIIIWSSICYGTFHGPLQCNSYVSAVHESAQINGHSTNQREEKKQSTTEHMSGWKITTEKTNWNSIEFSTGKRIRRVVVINRCYHVNQSNGAIAKSIVSIRFRLSTNSPLESKISNQLWRASPIFLSLSLFVPCAPLFKTG